MASISRSQLEYAFGSGGGDGVVRLWRFECPQDYAEDSKLRSLTLAHAEHKDSVNSVYYNPDRGILLSGADDGKLIAYSMNSASVVDEFQYADKAILEMATCYSPGNCVYAVGIAVPYLWFTLLSLEAKSDQLHICDYRTKQPSAQKFGFQQPQLLTRNAKPSFDSTGNMVICGDNNGKMHIWHVASCQPSSYSSMINFPFVIRDLRHLSKGSQVIPVHGIYTLGFY
ncbi:hypothetical protein K493DRAFT_335792 [Basidiobolus meristosporus CBS 931.73]|uniref:Uncharacterized protein n=1 Tax=Basidiobolus meristosporus CBS 931.73 TaxID=1314790 RepID=A0A1Y1YMT0_9FUNG|nr:hypothetical protein K493DRAFT_335792 [Basidiobolus meristosporus CBS 931.73]|eukprot:ORX99322.1 hypothetical protein K493DRAFT_335792 [Basidiobolus meristosporus CBS 931.73]